MKLTASSSIHPACPAVVAALRGDPFYRSIAIDFAADDNRCSAVLALYFDYSIREATRIGRAVQPSDPTLGVAVWVLPQSADVAAREIDRKSTFLRNLLGDTGSFNYHRIVEWMAARAKPLLPRDPWYLSIVAVGPAVQGRGLGQQLLAPTLSEADAARASCYVETFSALNIKFYERLGFEMAGRFTEPTTQAEYAVLLRAPSGCMPRNT